MSRRGRHHALVLDLADALRDQVLSHRLGVDALHLGGRALLVVGGDPLQLRVRILVAGPDPLEVQDREPAQLAERAGDRRRDDAVHRRGHQRQLEPVGPERPGDVDVVRIARAPRGHDRDVIEAVCAATLLAAPDLYFHWSILGSLADERPTLAPG
jgi:hypothetical protein